MNFSEIVDEVMSIVKRPDKLAEIRSAVNSTVQYCCTTTDFARDLVELSINVDAASYAQSLALSTFPRFRKFRYLKPSNRNSYIDPLQPDKVFVRKHLTSGGVANIEQLDKYYIAGESVVFKLCTLTPSVLVGFYAYPPVLSNAAGTFWLLDSAPYVVIEGAIAKAYRLIGDDASADRYQGQFLQSHSVFVKDVKSGVANG